MLNGILDGVLNAPVDGVLDAPVGGYLDARVDGILCDGMQNFKRSPNSITRKNSDFFKNGVPHILLDEVLRTLLDEMSD